MRWQPISYNGSTIHGTAYSARSTRGALDMMAMPASDAQFVSRGLDSHPVYAGSELRPREFSITIKRNGTGAANPTETQFGDMVETLNGVFYPPSEGTLVVWDVDASNAPYYIKCIPVGAPNLNMPVVEYQFTAPDPYFYAVTAGTVTTNLTASGQGGTITVSGNAVVKPTIRIAATGAKTGQYGYKIPVVTYNRVSEALKTYPLDAATTTAGSVWNMAGAVSGGTIQADYDDVRLFDGAEIDRWIGGPGAGTLRVFGNFDFAPLTQLTVETAVSASGTPSSIKFKSSSANKASLKAIPSAGELYNPATGERLTYSAKNTDSRTVTPQYRGVKGGAAGTIPAGGTLIWLDHPDVFLAYGNATAEAPDTDDSKKPIFNLTNSTNVSWDYDEFTDETGTRAGAWKPAIVSASSPKSLRNTDTYSADHMTDADPASEAGMIISAYQKSGVWKTEEADVEWRWYNPAGGTVVTVTGEKYRNSTSWPEYAALMRSTNGKTRTVVWDEASPGTASAWTNLTANGSAYALSNIPYLDLILKGSVKGGATTGGTANAAALEISDVTIGLNSSRTPFVARGAIQANYLLNCTITNTTTGKAISLYGLVALNEIIEIDCAAQTVTNLTTGADMSGLLVTSTARDDWFDLQPGANVWSYVDVGMGNVTVQWLTKETLL